MTTDLPSDARTAGADKVDPQTLELRATPARAIRFKRSLIVGLTAATSLGVILVTWFALQPHALRLGPDAPGRPIAATSPGDTLSRLPASYGDVPKLGPPLPGDLGRPILDQQRALSGDTRPGAMPQTNQRALEAHERRAAALKAARVSGLLAQTSDHPPTFSAPATVTPSPPALPLPESAKLAIDAERDPSAQQRKADFVRTKDTEPNANPYRIEPRPSPYTLSAGSVVAASLITGLRSDLPGLVTAQVTEQVFDSATGRTLLIPQGARLIGSYDSVVAYGQRRALLVWQRILFPDGSSLRIDNAPATDPSGYAGVADMVDFHTWALLKGVVLSTLLGVGAEIQFSGESDLVKALRQSTQQNGARAGDQLTSRALQVQPTITVRPGALVRLVVHRDLLLAPWQAQQP